MTAVAAPVPVAPSVSQTTQVYPSLRAFSVDEYHRMIQAGVLTEKDPVELLEGWIAFKMPRNPKHDAVVNHIGDKLRSRLPAGWHVRTQSAMTTSDSEPEPDQAVVRGSPLDYTARHPSPADIVLVVKVADSSLAHDRDVKARLYARAAIPCYWIVNLPDGVIEVYTDPSGPTAQPAYRRKDPFGPTDNVPLILPGAAALALPVRELLA